MASYRLAPVAADLVAAYEDDLGDIGQRPDHKVLWGARWFRAHVGEPAAFAQLPLDEQHAVNGGPITGKPWSHAKWQNEVSGGPFFVADDGVAAATIRAAPDRGASRRGGARQVRRRQLHELEIPWRASSPVGSA